MKEPEKAVLRKKKKKNIIQFSSVFFITPGIPRRNIKKTVN